MQFEALSLDYDRRLQCYMLSARVDYEWYLRATTGSEENLTIQRDIIKGTKSYETLRADIRRGCVLPQIVLSARNVAVEAHTNYDVNEGFIKASQADLDGLARVIQKVDPADVDIIDGLQRTNALRQTLDALEGEDRRVFLERALRLEVWLNIPFYTLAYRMLLLNAGQKPMSMKHQIDILSKGLANDLSTINGIDIIQVKDKRRRVRPGQFHLSTLAQVFQAWLQRNPNVDLRNMVVEQLLVDEAIDALGIDLNSQEHVHHSDDFRSLIRWLVDMDHAIGEPSLKFLGNDTVLLGIAAAVGFAHKNDAMRERLEPSLRVLLVAAQNGGGVGIEQFDALRAAIDPKRRNVGEATRELVFAAFREFIMQRGATPMETCWTQAASMVNL